MQKGGECKHIICLQSLKFFSIYPERSVWNTHFHEDYRRAEAKTEATAEISDLLCESLYEHTEKSMPSLESYHIIREKVGERDLMYIYF